jgi:hypothetical protein
MNQRVVQTNALPPNVVASYPVGANNIFTAGKIAQQNNDMLQSKLTGQNGGIKSCKRRKLSRRKLSKRNKRSRRHRKLSHRKLSHRKLSHRKLRGGNNPPVVIVPSAPSYAPNPALTGATNAQITGLAIATNNNAVYDKTVSQGDVNTIANSQNRVYYGSKGGSIVRGRSIRRRTKRYSR